MLTYHGGNEECGEPAIKETKSRLKEIVHCKADSGRKELKSYALGRWQQTLRFSKITVVRLLAKRSRKQMSVESDGANRFGPKSYIQEDVDKVDQTSRVSGPVQKLHQENVDKVNQTSKCQSLSRIQVTFHFPLLFNRLLSISHPASGTAYGCKLAQDEPLKLCQTQITSLACFHSPDLDAASGVDIAIAIAANINTGADTRAPDVFKYAARPRSTPTRKKTPKAALPAQEKHGRVNRCVSMGTREPRKCLQPAEDSKGCRG